MRNRTAAHCPQILTTRAEFRNQDKQLPGQEADLTGMLKLLPAKSKVSALLSSTGAVLSAKFESAAGTSGQIGQALSQDAKLQNKQLPGLQKTSGFDNKFTDQHSIHTLCTSNGSPYLNYQTRIM